MRPNDVGIASGVGLLAANSHLSTPSQEHFASSPLNRASNMIDTFGGVWNIPRDVPVFNWQDVPPNHSFRKLHVRIRAPWAQWYMNVVPLLGSPVRRGSRERSLRKRHRARTPAKISQITQRENQYEGRRVDNGTCGRDKGPCITMPTTCYVVRR